MIQITSDNFITDNKTNKVFVSSLIDTVSGALDIDVSERKQLINLVKRFCEKTEILVNTKDVWTRDYMPIQLTKNLYLGFTYKPDYLNQYPKYTTNWQLHNVHSQKESQLDIQVVQLPIILDGGNVVKAIVNDKPCMIMCDKVLNENNVNEKDFRIWWDKWWKYNFDGTEMGLVLLPWEGEKDNPIGHSDGIVRFIKNNEVLLTNYIDYDVKYHSCYQKKYLAKLEEVGFKVKELTFLDKFDYSSDKLFRLRFEETWCYINYLQVGNSILVPKLGYDKLNGSAVEQIKNAFGNNFNVELFEVDMTSIVKNISLDNKDNNSGGALNCLTWTIQE